MRWPATKISIQFNPCSKSEPGRAYAVVVQNSEYQVYASHLDPAELVIILNESGVKDGSLSPWFLSQTTTHRIL